MGNLHHRSVSLPLTTATTRDLDDAINDDDNNNNNMVDVAVPSTAAAIAIAVAVADDDSGKKRGQWLTALVAGSMLAAVAFAVTVIVHSVVLSARDKSKGGGIRAVAVTVAVVVHSVILSARDESKGGGTRAQPSLAQYPANQVPLLAM
jgi:hypothetical protein